MRLSDGALERTPFFSFSATLSSHHAPLCLISQADAPGIKATVSEAKDPKACKYTEEGTMVHDMMKRVATADRRLKSSGMPE